MLIPVPGRRFYTGELRVLPIFQQFTPGVPRGTGPLAARAGTDGPDSNKTEVVKRRFHARAVKPKFGTSMR